ncbi:hypothetical protein MPSEU_000072900 [Mayamaea pseudoterrestris]|nr:hypothetical protein MPSEU_000072900 [Mayamaea pseudoterrestris]
MVLGTRGIKLVAALGCSIAYAFTLFGSFSRQSFNLKLGVGEEQEIELTIHFGYHGYCIDHPSVGCTNYANDEAILQPIDEELLLQVGQYLSYASIGLGFIAMSFIGMSLLVDFKRKTHVIWGMLLGMTLPLSSFGPVLEEVRFQNGPKVEEEAGSVLDSTTSEPCAESSISSRSEE